MTIKQTLNKAIDVLNTNKEDDEIVLDARLLLEYTLDCDRAYLILHENEEMTSEADAKYMAYIEERLKGRPIEYIMNEAYFYGYRFRVNEYTLIPRPETEELVEYALSKLKNNQKQIIFDVGAGSGCIGISTCKNNANVFCLSIDCSADAIKVARQNAEDNEVSNQIQFLQSNLFDNVDNKYVDSVDMIISNPPYIRSEDIEGLRSKVKDFEPMLALDGGEDGLIFYRRISREAKKYLKKDGIIMFEVGHDQAEDVMNILKEDNYSDISCKKDLWKIDRIVTATI